MKKRICALFLFDGYADWEPALVLANLNTYSDFSIFPFSVSGKTVTSMGGLEINSQKTLTDIQARDLDLLLIPGGDAWEQESSANTELTGLVKEMISQKKVVAAICGATILLGKAGILNDMPHTSNSQHYLKQHCREYKGEDFYQQQPCVSANGIITANGAAMIEFAYQIYKAFQLFDADTLENIKDLYKSGGMVNRFHDQGAGAA